MKILLPLIIVVFLGCQSMPVDPGDVINTQADVAAGVETVAIGAAILSDQAATLADTLENMAQNNPEIAPVAAIAASHATFTANHAKDTQELKKAVNTARFEVVELVKNLGISEKKRLKAEGQRNTAWMALAGIAAVAGVLVFFKIKRWLPV